eukprot:14157256-Heterocapsa_arctica.AAC.1
MDQEILKEHLDRYFAVAQQAKEAAAQAKEQGEILEQFILSGRALELAQESVLELEAEEARLAI